MPLLAVPTLHRILLLTLLCTLSATLTVAQETRHTIRGRVVEPGSDVGINGAILTLHPSDSNGGCIDGAILAFGHTQPDGTYEFALPSPKGRVWCRVRLMGYETLLIQLESSDLSGTPRTLQLKESSETLPDLIVLGPPIVARGDTVTYRADDFRSASTYSAEDLLKRLPGVTVDARGIIMYMGEAVQGVHIEGMDLVERHYQSATRVLRAEDISAIDVMERFQKVKVLRGREEQDKAMINIRLKNPNMLAASGEVAARGGVVGHTAAGDLSATALMVNAKVQMIAAASIGNTNQIADYVMSPATSISSTSIKGKTGIESGVDHPQRTDLLKQRHGGTFNHLIRLTTDRRLKTNAGYEYSSRHVATERESRLYNGDDITMIKDEVRTHQSSHLAFVTTDYMNNADSLYTHNILALQGDYNLKDEGITLNGTTLMQQGRSGELRLSESYTSKRRHGDDLSHIEGAMHLSLLPYAHLYVPDGDYAYDQYYGGSNLRGSTAIGYSTALSHKLLLDGTLLLKGDIGHARIADSQQQPLSEMYGGILHALTTPELTLNTEWGKWKLSAPMDLVWSMVRYQAPEESASGRKAEMLKHHQLRLYPGVRLNYMYLPIPGLRLRAQGSYTTEEQQTFSNYLLGTYHASYDRITTQSTIPNPTEQNLGAHLHVSYRRPIAGFFGLISIAGKRSIRQNIVQRILHGTIREGHLREHRTVRNSIVGQIYASQLLSDLNTLATMSIDYSYRKSPIMVGPTLGHTKLNLVGYTMGINTTPWQWLDIKTNLRYTTSRISSPVALNKSDELLLEAELSMSLGNGWICGLDNETLWTHDEIQKAEPKSITNALLRYQTKRYYIELKCDNLLNEHTFATFRNIDADWYATYTYLRPRQLLIRFAMKY